MPILNSFQHLKAGGIKAGVKYKAQVTNNIDENKDGTTNEWGRIKFKIPRLFEFSPDDSPWAISEANGTDGASSKSGDLDVPAVNTWVLIEFQNGSLYHPVYSPMYINDEVKMKDERVNCSENYPFRKIHRYTNGMIVVVDTKSNELIIKNPGTANIFIDGDTVVTVNKGDLTVGVTEGNAYITAKKKIEITSLEGDLDISVLKGACGITVKEMCTVKAEGGIQLIGDSTGSDLSGVVCENYLCPITGAPHKGSTNVFATMGGISVPGLSP